MGYGLMPTFVGLQAPCNSFSGKIDPKQAASQGTAAANQAVTAAKSYGLGAGSPVYYDMEAYNHTNAGCRTAVLTFLDAWTRQLKAVGYVSGVYSSVGAAITDLQSSTTVAGHPPGRAAGHLVRAVGQREQHDRGALPDLGGVAGGQPVQAVRGQPHGEGGRDLPEHRRRLGGQRGRTGVTSGSPIRTGRIQFAITGPGS
jgi:Rv2525c-like, glycoside hydrolase-like domain